MTVDTQNNQMAKKSDLNILFVLNSAQVLFYLQSILDPLIREGNNVQVLFLGGTIGVGPVIYETRKKYPRIQVTRALDENPPKLLLASRSLLNYASFLGRESAQSKYFAPRFSSLLPHSIQYVTSLGVVQKFLALAKTRAFLRRFEESATPDERLLDYLKALDPSVLVLCGWWGATGEIGYLKAAKFLGIPTVVYAFTWDSLTTKGVVQIKPDYLLCWNRFHADQARTIHEIPAERILLTGATFFDKWSNAISAIPREVFCVKKGLSPTLPFCVYLASIESDVADEIWLVSEVAKLLRDHESPELRRMQILFRPHPVNRRIPRIDEPNVHVWLPGNALPETPEWVQEFYSALTHSVGTIGLNNSAMIDAIVNDCPSLALLTPEFHSFQHVTHFKDLLSTGALEVCDDLRHAGNILVRLLEGQDANKHKRRMFAEQYLRPWGKTIPAGKVAAHVIQLAARRFDPEAIDRELLSSCFQSKQTAPEGFPTG